MIDYRAGFLWWVYCEKFLVVLTDFRLEVHLLVWNASVTFLGLNRYSLCGRFFVVWCCILTFSRMNVIESLIFLALSLTIKTKRPTQRWWSLLEAPFPTKALLTALTMELFSIIFFSPPSPFILPAMPSTKTFLVGLVFGFAVLIPFHEQFFGF